MSVRRWIGIAGMVVAAAGGTATVRGAAAGEFEAQVVLQLQRPEPGGPPIRPFEGPEQLLVGPDVRELVRLRLGEPPPVQLKPTSDDTILLRSRGTTAQSAAEATKTYATALVDVRRQQSHADFAAAAAGIRDKIEAVESQLGTALAPQRAHLVEVQRFFTQRLDELEADAALSQGPDVIAFTPAEPVEDGTRPAWIVAGLGVAVVAGVAASTRRTGPRAR